MIASFFVRADYPDRGSLVVGFRFPTPEGVTYEVTKAPVAYNRCLRFEARPVTT